MNNVQLKRLLNLVRKTGDRLVVADKESDDVFVIMNLDEYEDLSDFNDENHDHDFDAVPDFLEDDKAEEIDEEMLEQINQNISEWREEKDKEKITQITDVADEIVDKPIVEDFSDQKEENVQSGFKSRKSSIPSVSEVLSEEKYRNRQFNDSPRTGFLEEEDLSDVSEEEEEKFYLEPVE